MLSRRTIKRAILALLLSCSIFYIFFGFDFDVAFTANAADLISLRPKTKGVPFTARKGSSQDGRTECRRYPDDGNIALVVKTGATEISTKLPAMLNTSLACVRQPLVLSDLEQKLGGLQVYDSLARFSRPAMRRNPDFDIYRKQLELAMEHRLNEIESLTTLPAPNRGVETANKSASWALDKYKFVHMIELAYELQPDRSWYVFIEADTYLSWANLKRWLAEVDHAPLKNQLYLGNAMRKSNRPPRDFAHGGSGIVLSGATVRELAVDRKGAASRADLHAHKYWAGDMMLADVLNKELAIQVTNVAPRLHHMDKVLEMPKEWSAQRVVAVHHVEPTDVQRLYECEQATLRSGLVLQDVYDMLQIDYRTTGTSRDAGTSETG